MIFLPDYSETHDNIRGSSGGGVGTLLFIILIICAMVFGRNDKKTGEKLSNNDYNNTQSIVDPVKKVKSVDMEIRQIQLNVHSCPSLSCKSILKVNRGDHVTATEDSGDGFYKIQYGDVIGYARLLATR